MADRAAVYKEFVIAVVTSLCIKLKKPQCKSVNS